MDERLNPDHPANLVEYQLHLSRYEYAVSALQKIKKQPTVLDIACGTGYGSFLLSRKTGGLVIGADSNLKTVQTAIKKYKKKTLRFEKQILPNLSFRSTMFDAVVCFETIEHLSEKQGTESLKQFYRILKPTGILILSTPNVFYTNIMKRLVAGYHNEHHIYEYTVSLLKQRVHNAGFTHIDVFGQYPFFPPFYLLGQKTSSLNWFFKPYLHLPAIFSRYIILTARKEQNDDTNNRKN